MSLEKLWKLCILIWFILTTFIFESSFQKTEQMNSEMSTISALLVPCGQTSTKDSSLQNQLIIKIIINPKTKCNTSELFFKIEEAYDPKKRKKGKISFPYLIEITRGESIMMYPLQYSESVDLQGKSKPIVSAPNKSDNKTSDAKNPDNKKKPKNSTQPKCKGPDSSCTLEDDLHHLQFSSISRDDLQEEHSIVKNEVQQNVGNCTAGPFLPRLTELISRTQTVHFNKTSGNSTSNTTQSGGTDIFECLHEIQEFNTTESTTQSTSAKEISKVSQDIPQKDLNFNIEICGQLKIKQNHDNEKIEKNHKNKAVKQTLKEKSSTDGKEEDEEENKRKDELKEYLVALLKKTAAELSKSDFSKLNKNEKSNDDNGNGNENESKTDEKRYAFKTQNFKKNPTLNKQYLDSTEEYEEYAEDEFPKEEANDIDPLDDYSFDFNVPKLTKYLLPIFAKSQRNYDVSHEELPASYEEIINNPSLSYREKLKAMKSVQPTVSEIERKYQSLLREFNIPDPDTTLQDSFEINSKRKRSFLMYDDLENGDTSDGEDIFKKFDIRSTNPVAEDDTASCGTCGGKKKKPPPCYKLEAVNNNIPNSLIDLEETVGYMCTTCGGKGNDSDNRSDLLSESHNCGCRTLKTPCICNTSKSPRSTKNSVYSIYKMNAPLPFVTTKIRIFRKCQNTWWSLVPSTALNTLSAMYANENMSIVLSSRMSVYQLENSLNLPQYELLIPKTNKSARSRRDDFEEIDFDLDEINENPQLILTLLNEEFSKINKREIVADMHMFAPATTKLISACPHRKRSVCLNVMNERSAGNIKDFLIYLLINIFFQSLYHKNTITFH